MSPVESLSPINKNGTNVKTRLGLGNNPADSEQPAGNQIWVKTFVIEFSYVLDPDGPISTQYVVVNSESIPSRRALAISET